jgi:hypothetical protein
VIAEAFERLEERYPHLPDLATQGHVRESELRLQRDIEQVRADLKGDIEQVRADLKGDIEQVRAVLKADIEQRTSGGPDSTFLRPQGTAVPNSTSSRPARPGTADFSRRDIPPIRPNPPNHERLRLAPTEVDGPRGDL